MKMKNFIVVNIILAALSGLTLAKVDTTKICLNNNLGDVFPNPEDCTSYILCDSVAAILYCEEGLHFDAARNICSFPKYAGCNLLESTPENSLESNAQDESNENEINIEPTQPAVDVESNIYYSPFVAIDVMSGLAVDPMLGYDPEHVVCRHFGAYFLPHPQNCRSYILCAYGHMHKHSCGRGSMWNFKKQQCEVSVKAECYSKTSEDDKEIVSTILPTTDNPLMICYTITATEGPPTNATNWQPTDSPAITTPLYSTPVATIKTNTQTQTTVVVPPSKSPNSVGPAVMECPKKKSQSYLAHPKDCSKYYMCIMGIPVLTSCPIGLYWDSQMEYCDLAKNVRCFQRKV